eukprot:jgi/Ulvmu1/10029/UM059_0078.1
MMRRGETQSTLCIESIDKAHLLHEVMEDLLYQRPACWQALSCGNRRSKVGTSIGTLLAIPSVSASIAEKTCGVLAWNQLYGVCAYFCPGVGTTHTRCAPFCRQVSACSKLQAE